MAIAACDGDLRDIIRALVDRQQLSPGGDGALRVADLTGIRAREAHLVELR
jgi:hypothetical protein